MGADKPRDNSPNSSAKKSRAKRRPGQHMTPAQRRIVQAAFLAAFQETANLTSASEAAGIDRTLVRYWQEHDETFSFQYHAAEEVANDRLRAEIVRRAVEGWEEPVYQLGRYAGTIRKYSDTLLIFQAKARMPEYRDKSPQLETDGQRLRIIIETDPVPTSTEP